MKSWKPLLIAILTLVGGTLLFNQSSALDRSQIAISAVSAGGTNNRGELIELKKLSSNPLSLTGLSIRYENSSGSVNKPVYEFTNVEMTGESLLLRLSSSESAENSDLVYSSPNLAQSGGKISLFFEDEAIDSVCWGNFNDCEYEKFTSQTETTLVRNFETNLFEHQENYEPTWEQGRTVLVSTEPDEIAEPHCRGLQFSEILSYYESSKSEQFIEFYNSSSTQINLSGCAVKYKNKTYPLEGIVLPERFFTLTNLTFTLTKNPTTSNIVELIDTTGEVVDKLIYYNGQKKATSLAQFGFNADGSENWQITFAPTPGEENNYQKYKTCPAGKVINEETGNCVTETSLSTELEPCPAGSYRNPLTNRCKKYSSTENSLKPCAEGYERNPETNRCRKVTSNSGDSYSLQPEEFEEKSSFAALWAIALIGAAGAVYVAFEYREEITRFFKKITSKSNKKITKHH